MLGWGHPPQPQASSLGGALPQAPPPLLCLPARLSSLAPENAFAFNHRRCADLAASLWPCAFCPTSPLSPI